MVVSQEPTLYLEFLATIIVISDVKDLLSDIMLQSGQDILKHVKVGSIKVIHSF